MKKCFNYYTASYHDRKENIYETRFFFTKEEAEKWLEKKGGSGVIKKWRDELNDPETSKIFEFCTISRIEMEGKKE